MKYAKLKWKVIAAQSLAGARYYAKAGDLEVRLARDKAEIKAAQRLRYQIFYEEMNATASARVKLARRDLDGYDPVCDHLLVIDHSRKAKDAVVGTYRLLRQTVAERFKGFYSSGEYDLAPLMTADFRTHMGEGRQLLELGRSCVHPDYRNVATINLLWRGISEYLVEHDIAYMFGCASLPGTDPNALKLPLSYLYHEHLVPDDFPVRAQPLLFEPMNLLHPEDYTTRDARRELPPLIKGYLRLGCFIGDGAVVDHQFGTTDVFILLPVERVTKRYSRHFELSRLANDPAETKSVAIAGL